MPVWVVRANGGRGGRIGRQAKEQDRRYTPVRPVLRLADGMDEAPQPAHRARRVGRPIIPRTGHHRNWQFAGQAPVIAPFMKIRQGVASKQPDETVLRIEPLEAFYRVDGEARAEPDFDVGDVDRAVPRHRLGRGQARLKRGHVARAVLQWIARCVYRGLNRDTLSTLTAASPEVSFPFTRIPNLERSYAISASG